MNYIINSCLYAVSKAKEHQFMQEDYFLLNKETFPRLGEAGLELFKIVQKIFHQAQTVAV
ncbi:MarR family transcriptional regulator [Neisseria wadsworthii 9715]|uniref:MarR family transcriptional regulator n=1 Tax=Neisseria wadsworthii 9715 TaxID=1030841 RepID=G4CQK1_9NEIS|nr:MarR family transcriptional regulator [Neisseria wadsworthii 9715]